ncbi:Surfactin synthase thioesterase subunit [Paenibacillus uliginis N3/975]|uniref:Surfactin synthase thioesterase subunit n=1 Tax=Paenibacillus uliginis N3/975 TaxID=1313296 RepID=A0A1X7GYW0_9BACL|nr:Surfactin synthase thioesterase subunit [Paenibacillus uliginis N3/975]
MKLFCIPYAGGSSSFYFFWKKTLNEDIELIPLELAGKGRRISEDMYKSFHEMVDDVYSLMLPHIKDGSPFAVFGHSMGGSIVYEIAERLEVFNVKHLFISGCRAPHLKREERKFETDEEMIRTLVQLGGTPIEFLRNKDFVQTFFPIIRGDLKNLYAHSFEKKKITTPTTIMHGTKEDCIIDDVLMWNEYFYSKPNIEFFDGGHFFIEKFEKEVTYIINKALIETTNQNKEVK